MSAQPSDRPADPRQRADQLRDAIASRAVQIRRDATEMVSATRRQAGSVRLGRFPSWVLAAAAGAVAGLLAAVRRRKRIGSR